MKLADKTKIGRQVNACNFSGTQKYINFWGSRMYNSVLRNIKFNKNFNLHKKVYKSGIFNLSVFLLPKYSYIRRRAHSAG